MWGSQQYCKMGFWYADKNWEVPKPVIWQIVNPQLAVDDDDFPLSD